MQEGNFGMSAHINLYDCKHDKVVSRDSIESFVQVLCMIISMERFGDLKIENFGKDDLSGYSFMQFIETSSITGHFVDCKNNVYLDIFSCKKFDPQEALDYAKKFFESKRETMHVLDRP